MSSNFWQSINTETKLETKTSERRILAIGDLHAPFELHGYFDFCKRSIENTTAIKLFSLVI